MQHKGYVIELTMWQKVVLDLSFSCLISQGLGLQSCSTKLGICSAKYRTQDFMRSRKAVYTPSYITSCICFVVICFGSLGVFIFLVFLFVFEKRFLLCIPSWHGTDCVFQAGLEFAGMLFLPLSLQCWHFRQVQHTGLQKSTSSI